MQKDPLADESMEGTNESDPFDEAGEDALAELVRPSRVNKTESQSSNGDRPRLLNRLSFSEDTRPPRDGSGLASPSLTADLASPLRDRREGFGRKASTESDGDGLRRRRKRKRILVVYGPVGGSRAELVKRLVADFPHVFCCPTMICTGTEKDVHRYGTGHPCELVSKESFQEHVSLNSLLLCFSVTDVPSRASGSQSHGATTPSAVGSPRDIPEELLGLRLGELGDSSHISMSPTSDYESEPVSRITSSAGLLRDRSRCTLDNARLESRLMEEESIAQSDSLLTVGEHEGDETVGKGTCPKATSSHYRTILFGITKAAMMEAMQLNSGVLLSVDHTASADLLKQPATKFAISFLCLAPTKTEGMPWRTEHPTIITADNEMCYTEFSNAALVAMAMLQSAVTPRDNPQNTLSQANLQACSEWESVETIELTFSGKKSAVPQQMKDFITFAEALAFFQSQEITNILSTSPQHLTEGTGSVKLSKSLSHEHHLMLSIINQPFDNNRPLHQRVLQTIYKKLTGTVINCPRFGTHWQAIGFQGTDPSTDLRSMGFWSLMQLLHFVSNDRLFPLALSIYKLSQEVTQNFPFCVMSINITKIALQVLNSGSLNKLCNKREQVISCINDVYVALFYQLFFVWKKEHKTIADSGFLLKDLESFAQHHPKRLLQQADDHIDNFSNSPSRTPPTRQRSRKKPAASEKTKLNEHV